MAKKCEICGRWLKNKRSLKKHITDVHKKKEAYSGLDKLTKTYTVKTEQASITQFDSEPFIGIHGHSKTQKTEIDKEIQDMNSELAMGNNDRCLVFLECFTAFESSSANMTPIETVNNVQSPLESSFKMGSVYVDFQRFERSESPTTDFTILHERTKRQSGL
jgi:hypothetical protein